MTAFDGDDEMSVVVKLEAVLEAMDLPQEWESFLDPETGEIVTISEDDRFALDGEDLTGLPEWQRESVIRIRRVLDSGRGLRLPDSYDIHEWDLMRRFSTSVEDPDDRGELLEAIHGKGAFRLFKVTIARLDLREEWFRYRDEALRRIAKDWLERHEVPFVEQGWNRGQLKSMS